jgi:hypothetical protein
MAHDYETAKLSHWKTEEVKLINGCPVRFRDVCVHTIRMSDVEDPDIMVAEHLLQWQTSEAGRWIMSNAEETPYWIRHMDISAYAHIYRVMARMSEQNETFWRLKWG